MILDSSAAIAAERKKLPVEKMLASIRQITGQPALLCRR
jgi:hypothetical protein